MNESLDLQFGTSLDSLSTKYRTLQKLGEGGTANTYLVLASSGEFRGQLFALKLFRRLSKPEWRDNFLQEVAFLKSCSHPSVMRVYDEGIFLDKLPFVVAEYPPSTLATALRMNPGMMAKMAYSIQLLSALEYLSRPQIQVIHRDIKPPNIFIKGGSCVLGDFGLMKRLKDSSKGDLNRIKASFGPRMPRRYRTPDLVNYFKGGPVPTEKSDIFQLGIVFVEMFTGKNPQKPMQNFRDPIQMNNFKIEGGMGPLLMELITPMLHLNPSRRPAASALLSTWQELFLEAAKRSHALEGRVV
ncbi:protein kinase family protein [Telmatocola sphagniphila]|uniref:non-specific serine/threonine protein kinase n=1 Tax=Telmatocola sphagniphila TaxID=1123043 RepID=A0A8E6EXP2_9BACT|nr:protein kinase family protein [Telmatocola sphagniphila]QVL31838.1 protein kinase family protein [Telmatocola sphagniphila]